jgi:group I intron endonuclease
MGYIYKITNKITSQCYVGQTTQKLEERWRQHKNKKSNCKYLKTALKKYGIENFEFKLICICFDNDLNKFEIEYIKKYDSLIPNGYNLRSGGQNGGKHNEETKIKISCALKNRTDIIRNRSQLGKPHTEEIKNKISNSLKGRKKNREVIEKMIKTKSSYDDNKRNDISKKISQSKKGCIKTSKVIEQYDLNNILLKTFPSISDASKELQISRSSIQRCSEKKYKCVKGYIFKYKL